MASPPIPEFPHEGNYGNLEYAIGELRPAVEYLTVISQLEALDELGKGGDVTSGRWEALDRFRSDLSFQRWVYLAKEGEWSTSGSSAVTYRGQSYYYAHPEYANNAIAHGQRQTHGLYLFEDRWRWLNRIPLADTAPFVREVTSLNLVYQNRVASELDANGAVAQIHDAIAKEHWDEEAARGLRGGLFTGPIINRNGNLIAAAAEGAAAYHEVLKTARQGVYELLTGTIRTLYQSAHGAAETFTFGTVRGLAGNIIGAKANYDSASKIIQAAEEVVADIDRMTHSYSAADAEGILGESKGLLEAAISDADSQFGSIARDIDALLDIFDGIRLNDQAVPPASDIL